jgi:hypothetical protein
MANLEELQKQHEARLQALINELAGAGQESDLALARALIHKGVHLAVERRAGEFCAVATFLSEMVGHAHGLMHPGDSGGGKHN